MTVARGSLAVRRAATAAVVLTAIAACSTSSAGGRPAVARTGPVGTAPDGAASGPVASGSPGSPVSPSEPDSPGTPASTPATLPACVAGLDLRAKVALVVWPAADPANWDAALQAADQGIGGVVLMSAQRWTRAQIGTHLTELRRHSSHGLLISTDEEGGDVQRLRPLGLLPSQRDQSALSADAMRALLDHHAKAVKDVGVDVILGPVVDVLPEHGKPPLVRSRFYTGGPDEVAARARIAIAAWNEHGLAAVIKHFPGHGSASADTHKGQATTPSLAALQQRDLLPYRQLADLHPMVMVGHLIVPELGPLPASANREAVALLRGSLGYGDALVMTDALDMLGSATRSLGDAALDALKAGIDVVIFGQTSSTAAVIDRLVAAVRSNELPQARLDEAAARVARAMPGGLHCAA